MKHSCTFLNYFLIRAPIILFLFSEGFCIPVKVFCIKCKASNACSIILIVICRTLRRTTHSVTIECNDYCTKMQRRYTKLQNFVELPTFHRNKSTHTTHFSALWKFKQEEVPKRFLCRQNTLYNSHEPNLI